MNTQHKPRWKQALCSALRPARAKRRREAELAVTMRAVCHQIIADLPQHARLAMAARIELATRRNDVPSLRVCLFDAISMQHGERIARERLASLDSNWP